MLFHGLTNCPQQFDEFAQLLHARGDNVYVPRLPYHGDTNRLTRAIGNITVADIEARGDRSGAARRAVSATRVNALGLSLGATMALWLAQTGGGRQRRRRRAVSDGAADAARGPGCS